MYCTPNRYRIGNYGIDVSAMTDLDLASHLTRASTIVDSWCNVPTIPTKTDFRGGTVTAEQNIWRPAERLMHEVGTRRVYLSRRPIRQVTAFSIVFTASYRIDLDPSNLYVNSHAGFIEVVASQPTIIGFPPLGYWMGLAEPITETTYTYGWRYAVVDEVCYAATSTTYYASQGMWDKSMPVTVKVNGSPTSATINYEDGSVTFSAAPSGTVTVSYTATLPQAIAEATAIIATHSIAASRNAARGLLGLTSLRVAEVTFDMLRPTDMVTRNGISIPVEAANLLGPYVYGS
jgi:hypothetical protein